MAEPLEATQLRWLRIVGTAAVLALIALVASLDRWVAVDDAVWRGVLTLRGCGTDLTVERTVELATRALAAVLVVAVVLNVRVAGAAALGAVWPWIGTWFLGLLVSKMLKHLLTRDRPSALPDLAVGYSFPSAHVMNGILAMTAVLMLTYGFRHRWRWYAVATSLTAVVAGGRVLLGRHWATDVLGGAFSALVLVGFVVPALVRRPVLAPTVLAVVAAAALVVDRRLGDGGVQLPSPLVGRRAALVDVHVEPGLRPVLLGSWKEAGRERVVGSYLWLLGDGTVPLDVPADATTGRPLRLAFGGRPQRSDRSCVGLEVALNGQTIGRFLPFVGWREYRLAVPPRLLRAGRNELTIMAAGRDGPARFGIRYVRVAREASAAE